MSVLSDRDIAASLAADRIRIRPYDPADLQPSSVDLHLDRSFRVFRNSRYAFIDVRSQQPDLTELLTVADDEPLSSIRVNSCSARRSSGSSCRMTSWLALELSNVAGLPIALYAGMKIGQISFLEMSSPVDRPYGSAGLGSKYQGQSEPTVSAFHEDFKRAPAIGTAPEPANR